MSLYFLLNLMSESGIDAYRVASVLGYCLLPLVLLSLVTVLISLESVPLPFPSHPPCTRAELCSSGLLGYLLFLVTILWCSYSASGIFVSVLRMSEQRFLVAYPVLLFYATFALLSVFDAGSGGLHVKGGASNAKGSR